jgi:hypothetical protein
VVKGFRGFGGQDGYVIPVAMLHKQMDVIDGSLQSASPCPSELLIMAPRYSDPENIQRSRHTRLPKVGHYGQGLPPVKLNIECLKL